KAAFENRARVLRIRYCCIRLVAEPSLPRAARGHFSAPCSSGALVVAALVAAEDDLALLLGLLLEKVGTAAVRAGLGDGLVVGGELALRVAPAAVEEPAPAALALHDLSHPAVRAEEADLASLLLLDVGTGGVVAAGDEGAESPAPPHEVVLAD